LTNPARSHVGAGGQSWPPGHPAITSLNLTPAAGRPTDKRRNIQKRGVPLSVEEACKYIRVTGSDITRLEPHYWGPDNLAIVPFLTSKQRRDSYYILSRLRRIEITVRKLDKQAKIALRKRGFDNPRGVPRKIGPVMKPWHQVPPEAGRARYVVWLAQTHPDQLRAAGFSDEEILESAHTGSVPILLRNGKEIRFNVHHRIPLQAGGSNAIENLVLVEEDLHGAVFHSGDDPLIAGLAPGQSATVVLTVPEDDVNIVALGPNAWEYHLTPESRKG
jgi:hypothetical protein